ncbi:uncharacterized protein G2W53_000879 [Senna tora]|uniref:Uncharacterized protein n=1 Tax=Senna tora TaxID=362788 RepID=A0A835CIX4_9FABA|nr:uncharacterized protein G2W53_000879 [Senna tora]
MNKQKFQRKNLGCPEMKFRHQYLEKEQDMFEEKGQFQASGSNSAENSPAGAQSK